MRVLIADDEERICELIQFLGDFQEQGMECLPFCEDGKRGFGKGRERTSGAFDYGY